MKRVSLFITIGFFVFLTHVMAQPSATYFSQGQYQEVIKALKAEFEGDLPDQHAFLSRLRMAGEAFIQDSSITLDQLNAIYDAAFKQSSKFYMEKRVLSEKAALNKILLNEKEFVLPKAVSEFKKIQSLGKSKENRLEKSTRLFALTTVLRRKSGKYPDAPDWNYWIGKCYQLESKDPTPFFELYLKHQHMNNLSYANDAYAQVQRQYQLDFKGQVPLEIEADLKELKSKVDALEIKNKKKK